jgi:hypothetical protein
LGAVVNTNWHSGSESPRILKQANLMCDWAVNVACLHKQMLCAKFGHNACALG